MNKNFYQPMNNYERNLLMTKKFCGKFTVLLLPILLFFSMICSCYLKFVSEDPLELYIIRVASSKLGLSLDMGSADEITFFIQILISGFLMFALLYIFFRSKDSDAESNPDMGISLLHKFSQIQLILTVMMFIFAIVITAVFIFGDAGNFKSIGSMFNLTESDLKAYKVTISIILVLIDILAFVGIWYVQSQTNFLKSLRMCLYDSIPKNKGAHTYGVFSLGIGILFLCVAGIITFLYYCYSDTFSGFGINLDKTYVYVSLCSSYINGLIPFMIGVNSFIFSSMVDEINTMGTLYNDYAIIGPSDGGAQY